MMNRDDVLIVGAGGFGKEVRSMISVSKFSFGGFLDDDLKKDTIAIPINQYLKTNAFGSDNLIIAVGSSKSRSLLFDRLPSGCNYPSIIHPSAIIQGKDNIQIEKGVIISAGAILTCDIKVGSFTLINLNCTIGHDCILEDFVSLMPSVNLGGNVHLKKGVYVGTNATILPGVTVGEWSVIGAGSVVTKDVPPNTTVKGIPAK